jgi:NADPH:quinone reductase-like Zn-dependent oxidoreductase
MLSTALLLLIDAATFSPGQAVPVHSASGVGNAMAPLVPIPGRGRHIDTVGRAEKAPSAWGQRRRLRTHPRR